MNSLEHDLNAWKKTGCAMFARVLTGSVDKPSLCAKFLVDSGNLGRSLVSEKLALSLKWQIHPCKHSIKSAQGNQVTILGETNPVSFIIQGCPGQFQWRFLVIRNLCAPGVFGIDFLKNFNVGIQMSRAGQNYLTFSKKTDQTVPLVPPNAPNLPPVHEDDRFLGARVFRQQAVPVKASQTAAALQEEVGRGACGRSSGRPPDIQGQAAAPPGGGHLPGILKKTERVEVEQPLPQGEPTPHCQAHGEGSLRGRNDDDGDQEEWPEVVTLKSEKRMKIQPHYRAWVTCRAPAGMDLNGAVLVDEEALKTNPGRKQGIKVVEAINYMRKGRVSVLVENNSEQPVQIGLSYPLAQAYPMIEPEVDWARGHYSIDQVNFILQQEREGSDNTKQEDGGRAWPTDEELQSRGPNSWWDPCKGMTEAERILWVEEVFRMDQNEYLKKHPQWRMPYLMALAKYTDCIAGKGHVEAIPETTWVSMSLDTLPGARPIHQRPRPLSPPDQEDLDRQLAIWIRQRVIQPAVEGAWALNLVPVRKKGVAAGVRRWTIDARGINLISEPRPEYIGSVGSNLEDLADQNFFCQLDLANAFLSIPIKPEHVHKASFVTPRSGAWSLRRSGYGFKNSPAALEQLGTAIMRPIPPRDGSKYMDDFLLKSSEPGPLLQTLCTFFEQIRAANVKIQASKCHILATRVVFLGHLVVGGEDPTKPAGLYPDPELLATILGTPVPDSAPSLKRYLGQLAFYNQFLVGISAATASLHQAKNRVPFKLTEEEVADFKQSLQILANSPALSFPDFTDLKNRPFILAGDFSPVACNASLHQYQAGGLRLLGAVGRTNRGAAQRWGSMRGEAAAVRLGLDKWRHLLLRFWFVSVTDNLSLTHVKNMKDPTGFWARFLEHLSQFKVTFVHRSGIHGPVEDAWSRMNHHPDWSKQEEYNLADYEDENDEERGPGVPSRIPIGLRELLSKRSKGLDKPWEVQGASHLDEPGQSNLNQITSMMSTCSIHPKPQAKDTLISKVESTSTADPALKVAVEELNRRAPEVAQSLVALAQPWHNLVALATATTTNQPAPARTQFFSDWEEDYFFPEETDASLGSESSSEEEEDKDEAVELDSGSEENQPQVPYNYWVNAIRPEFGSVRALPNRLTLQQKSTRQRVNPILREVIKWVNKGEKPSVQELRGKPKDLQAYANMWELLRLREGVLYMKSELGGEGRPDRWCVPANSLTDVLDIAHIADARHMATESTLNRVKEVAWWPSMKQDVEDFVLACPGCRPKHQAPKGHLLAQHRPRLQSRANQTWYLDLVGPLNTSVSGMKHIFTCLDGFSRYVSAIPIRDKKAQTVINCLKSVINIWGVPEETFCDHGKELDNQFMREEARKLGIRQFFTISYEARPNKAERYHRLQSSLLRSALAETNDYENWPKYVPEVVRAYNTSVHAVTRFTPHRLQTGYEYSGPLTMWIGPPEEESDLPMEERERLRVRKKAVDELKAIFNQTVYQKRQAALYRNKPSFIPEVGQKVFIYLPVAIKANNQKGFIARKLSSGWCGPWQVEKKITDQIFRVLPMDGNQQQGRIVSTDRMEPYREGHRYDSSTTAVPLAPEHPLVKLANDDTYAETIAHSNNEDEERGEVDPWRPLAQQPDIAPAWPLSPPAGPDEEEIQPMPQVVPDDEVMQEAESGREGAGQPAGPDSPHLARHHSGTRGSRDQSSEPRWRLRVRFRLPERESRSLSSSTLEGAERRSRRRDSEVNRRRGVEEASEMEELKPKDAELGGGGGAGKDRGGADEEGEGEQGSSLL